MKCAVNRSVFQTQTLFHIFMIAGTWLADRYRRAEFWKEGVSLNLVNSGSSLKSLLDCSTFLAHIVQIYLLQLKLEASAENKVWVHCIFSENTATVFKGNQHNVVTPSPSSVLVFIIQHFWNKRDAERAGARSRSWFSRTDRERGR